MKHKTLLLVVVYLGGLLTGLSLILYPAMGTIFTDPSLFAFSGSQFGNIFIPQTLLAILASLTAPFFVSKWRIKKVLISGVLALSIATFLLFLSHLFIHNKTEVLFLIFAGTSFLGLGFGLVITIFNPLAFNLFPNNEVASITGLHFTLGVGTAGAPLLLGMLSNPNLWWYIPLGTFFSLLILLLLVLTLKLEESTQAFKPKKLKIPPRLWGFIAIVTFYGICEGTLGSYGTIFLKSQGLSIKDASLGLAVFWAGLAFGRISFSLLSIRFKMNWFFILAPFLVALLLFVFPLYKGVFFNISIMGMAGVFMASIFPSTVSWATKEFSKNAVLVSGLMVASLQFGTGISTNFLGYLSKTYTLGLLLRYIGLIAILVFVGILILKKYPKKAF